MRRVNRKKAAFRKQYKKVPKRTLSKKVAVKSRFFYSPPERECLMAFTNDQDLILRKPNYDPYINVGTTLAPNWHRPTGGVSETHFRFSPSVLSIQSQIEPYRAMYREMIITGITITFKPTWNRKILTEGLKIQQVLANGDYKNPATWWQQNVSGQGEAFNHADALISARDSDAVLSNEMLVSTMGKIPYGAFPRLYAKHLDYGDSQNGGTIMANQAQAKMRRAPSVSLINGTKKTYRFVPKMFKAARTADGLEITKPVAAGWFPTDDIHLRRFGGMDFCISPFPNFDVQTEKDSRLVYDYNTGKWGPQGVPGQQEDRTSLNDHQVIVRRTYHIKFRGRKRHQTDLNEKLRDADWNLKPTDLDWTQKWSADTSMPLKNDITAFEQNLFADIHTQTACPLSLTATAGLIVDTVAPIGSMPATQQGKHDFGNVNEEVNNGAHKNTILSRLDTNQAFSVKTDRARLQPYGMYAQNPGEFNPGITGAIPGPNLPGAFKDNEQPLQSNNYAEPNRQPQGAATADPKVQVQVPRPDVHPPNSNDASVGYQEYMETGLQTPSDPAAAFSLLNNPQPAGTQPYFPQSQNVV